jgi:hypothetical protein
MLDWFKRGSGPGSNAGIFEYYRMLAEELDERRATPGLLIRLRAPLGVDAVRTLSGLYRNAADGTSRCQRRTPRRCCGWGGHVIGVQCRQTKASTIPER